jgi:hypothetical protein
MRTIPWPPGGTWALDVLWARLEIGAAMKRLLKAGAWGCRQGPDHRQRSVTSVEEIRHVCLVVDLDRDRVLARPARRPEGHNFIGYFIFSLSFFPAAIIVAYLVHERTRVPPRPAAVG